MKRAENLKLLLLLNLETVVSIFIYLSLIGGFFGFLALACYAYRRLNRGWSFQTLFRDFRSKVYMTLSLGFVFLCVYLLLVAVSMLLAQKWGAEMIALFNQHKIEMIYAGLGLFILLSLSIIVARMVVKYFYLKR